MVSRNRAAQSIGRRIRHLEGVKLQGTVDRVDKHDVWVKTTDGDVVPCIPENMEWTPSLTEPLRAAIEGGVHYETAQVFYSPYVYADECDEGMDYDDRIPNVGVLGSSGTANDDNENRALVLVAPMIRRAYAASITVDPHLALEVEELLGWAEP